MKVLLAIDGSQYTKHMLTYLAAHDEWFNPSHEDTAFHGVLALPHQAVAFARPGLGRGYCDDDAPAILG